MTCAQEACPILNMHCKLCFSAARAVCRWAYEQVAEALCKLYKDPHGRVGQHLHHGSPRAGCPGALADALLALAQGLASAHTDIRYAHLAVHLLSCHPICLSQRPIRLGRQSVCHINGLAAAWFWITMQIEHQLAVYSLFRILACQAHRQLYNSSGAEVLKVNVYAIVTLTQYYRVPGCSLLQHTLPMTNACL